MFDLSIKDKPKTPFGKLKEKMKGKKVFNMESSSAIVPSSVGRLDSDDDERKPKSKAAAFLMGRLRKSSLTKSNTSLGSDSTTSSISGTMPTSSSGITIVLPDTGKKPASRNSSLSADPSVKDAEASPRMTHKRAFSDEVSQLKVFPEPKGVQNLKPKSSPISKSSVCINGSHVYTEVPLPKPPPSLLEKSSPASWSVQNNAKKTEEVTFPEVVVGNLHGSEKTDKKQEWKPPALNSSTPEEAKVPAKAAALKPKNEELRQEIKPVQIATPMVFKENVSKDKNLEGTLKEEKPKVGLLHHKTSKNEGGCPVEQTGVSPAPQVSSSTEERGKTGGWFSPKDTKDTSQKPSLDVSPQVESSSSASSCFPAPCDVVSVVADPICMPRTNPNIAFDSGVLGSLSANNPFLNSLQSNPFFEDLISDQLLNSSSPTHFFSSFPSGSIATSEAAERGSSLVEEHSPLAFSLPAEDQKDVSYQHERAFRDMFVEDHAFQFVPRASSRAPLIASEWEEQFDTFAASRLQPEANSQRLLETNDQLLVEDVSERIPSHPDHSIQGVCVQMNESRTPETSVDSLREPHPTNLNVQVVETYWPDNTSEIKSTMKEEISPFPTSPATNYCTRPTPPVNSARIRTSAKDFTSCGQRNRNISGAPSDKQMVGYESNGGSALWHTDEHFAAKGVTANLSGSAGHKLLGHVSQGVSAAEETPEVVSKSNEDAVSPIPEATNTTNMIAAVSPLISKDNSMTSGPLLHQKEVPDKSREPINVIQLDAAAHQIVECSDHYVEQFQHLAEIEGAFVENISNNLFAKDVEAERVTQPEDRLQFASGDVVSMVPPKPPCLMWSPEGKEMDGDNYKQTRNQDHEISHRTAKQTESPKDKVHEQNTGVSKETDSPVACCPVIEVVTSMLPSISEDTQSVTEDPLTHLRERNNDLTKLGASNGEHLLDVNDTVAEQFRTCLSRVSLDGLGLSSAEDSNKLDALKLGSSRESISNGQSKPLTSLESIAQERDDFNFLKPMPLAWKGKEKGVETETSNSTKSIDHTSSPFWTALEEQLSTNITDPPLAKQDGPVAQCENVFAECRPVLMQDNVKCRTVPNKGESPGIQFQVEDLAKQPQNDLVDIQLQSCVNALEDESGLSMSLQSTWSADVMVDFKNEDFWRSQTEASGAECVPLPGNPFTPTDKSPFLNPKNPFIEGSLSNPSSEVSFMEGVSFKDLHAQAAPTPLPPTTLPSEVKTPFLHGGQPLAFSTPSFIAASSHTLSNFPSPIMSPTTSGVTNTTNTPTAVLSCCHSPVTIGVKASALSVLPQETQPAENPFMPLKTSPHPVKPISAALPDSGPEKKNRLGLTTALTSGLEMLKTVTGGQHPAPKKSDLDRLKDPSAPDLAAKYYHLTHDELIHMLLQREAELGKKAKQVQALEDYIDQLLVRIMEQAPTLLQVPLESKKDKQ
ncbi:hypothetical protein FKM82_019582 [Ascaphus truei]